MADPMKIRARLEGDVADVRVLMAHPMETGQRKQGGKVVPLHFIQTITATLNGQQVFAADISQAISRNPVFAFKVKGAKAGDKIGITWKDNKGDSRSDETTVRGGS
jgi:sulfur-oxidizing protein SoxZ